MIAIVTLITIFPSCVPSAQSTVALVNNYADDPGHLLTAKSAPADMKFRQLEIVFKIRDQKALDKLLAELSDPSSPEYGHSLTSNEFDRRFYPTPAERLTVVQWLENNGFTFLDEGSNFIKFIGTVSQVRHAFGVEIYTSADGRYFGNTADPEIPASLAPFIAFVMGLNNLSASYVGFLANPPGQNSVGFDVAEPEDRPAPDARDGRLAVPEVR